MKLATRRGGALAACILLLTACGGGGSSGPDATEAGAGDAEGGAPAAAATARGPDSAQAKERLLLNANMITPDAARIVSYNETSVQYEGPQELQTAIVTYEAELEFTADTYFQTDRKAGDRAQVFGEIEYLNEGGHWRILTMGIFPR